MAGDRILVVAAHPDDEVLGCGGTVARHAAAGDEVHVLIVAEGATSRDPQRNPDARGGDLKALRDAALAAAKALGSRAPIFADFPDNRLDSVALLDVVKRIETAVNEIRPRCVYTHHAGDLNVDHQIVHQAVLAACRPLPNAPVKAIYAFETASATEWGGSVPFQPTRFVDISATLDKKLAALDCYRSEMRPFPHARSREALEALALLRGTQNGLRAAEAFVVIREIA